MNIEQFQDAFAKSQKGDLIEYWRTRENGRFGLDTDCDEKGKSEAQALRVTEARQIRSYTQRLHGAGQASLVQKRLNDGEIAYCIQVR